MYLLLYFQDRKPKDIIELFRVIEPAERAEARKRWPNDCCHCGIKFYSCHAREAMWYSDDNNEDDLETLVVFLEKYLANEHRKRKGIKSRNKRTPKR
jgi:hypothetical protein